MTTLIFTYGTLKSGFPNFHINAGTRVPGEFTTVERYPLYIVGRAHIPWLVDRPGEGGHVCGQLFEVDARALAQMDVLERLDEPGWYRRCEIEVRSSSEAGADVIRSQVYFGDAQRLESDPVQAGPLAVYTLEHASLYRAGAP